MSYTENMHISLQGVDTYEGVDGVQVLEKLANFTMFKEKMTKKI